MDYSRYSTEKKRKEIRSGALKSRKKIGFNILRILIIAIIITGLTGAAAGIGGFKAVIDSAPKISVDDVMPNKLKSVIHYSDGKEAVELVGAQSNRTIVSIDDLPSAVPAAFIAIEDQRFYEHKGIDPKGIVRALFIGLKSKGDFSQGASTITQQLIKLTVFDGGAETDTIQRFKRKFQEWYLALQLEKDMTKDEIMEAYLNTINLGRGAYGVQSAAERYFNKEAKDLTISEAAVIAAIAQSPSYNNPIDGLETNQARREKILNNMLSLGFINKKQYKTAMKDDVYSRIEEVNEIMEADETLYTWFEDATIDAVLNDLQEKLGYTAKEASNALFSGGLHIYMTQDRRMQEIVDRHYKDDSNFTRTEYYLNWALTYKDRDGKEVNVDQYSLQAYYGSNNCDLLYDTKEQAEQSIADYKEGMGIRKKDIIWETTNLVVQTQSSFVIMDQHNGHVLALVGGRGEKTTNRGFNRATQATRQPGSVFKPIAVFLPALDACGLTLASTKVDEPYTTPDGFEVFNTNASSYSGTTTIRQAITNSMNVVTTKWLVEDVSPQLGIKYLQDLGLSTIDEVNDAFAPLGLGGIYNGVTNLELTAAYASIANGGVYTEPILYTKILDKDGNVLIDNEPEQRAVMKPTTAWLLTSAMQDVVSKGTGYYAQIDNWNIEEAGKTGTTNEWKDLWFVGYTPYYTAGVWYGYDNSISMRGRISSAYVEHKLMWRSIMNEVLEGYEAAAFEMPEGITKATVCKGTGLLASSACPTITEYFDGGELPTTYCDEHSWIGVNICKVCGKKATSATPEEYVEREYYRDYDDMPGGYCEHTGVDNGDQGFDDGGDDGGDDDYDDDED